jgi:hypothetical protein
MILKTANLLYLFDFDGTIAGSDDWFGFFSNCKLSFRQLHFNPGQLDIRWCILTSRPKIDMWLLKAVCKHHKLKPKHIFTGPTYTWKFKSTEQEAKYKEQIIKSILDGTFDITYTRTKITKVCYIDNNNDIVKSMNNTRGDYKYLAMSVSDFIHRDFVQLLS